MAVEQTFVYEVKEALLAAGFTVVGSDFDRTLDFPQVLVRFGGFISIRSTLGERIPRVVVRVAMTYRRAVRDDLHEQVEDVASNVFDAVRTIDNVLSFEYAGVQVFEPLDGTEAEYLGVSFTLERAGGVPRGGD